MNTFPNSTARKLQSELASLTVSAILLASSTGTQAQLFGVNFAGDPALSTSQSLLETDGAGILRQKFWNNAFGLSGSVAVEGDSGTSMAIFYSGFGAHWQARSTGSAPISGVLPNPRLMKGSLLATASDPVLVQFSGVPIPLTSGGYAAIVYCDAPANTTNITLKVTLEAGSSPRSVYLRDAGNAFSSFVRAPLSSNTDRGAQTPTGNVAVFTGLNATELAIVVEPAESNPGAMAAVNAVQLVPASALSFAPRLISAGEISAQVNQPFSYQLQTDFAPTSWSATGLPAGLQVNPATGLVTGTPQVPGTYPVEVTVSNTSGATSEHVTIVVTGQGKPGPVLYMVPALRLEGEVGQTHRVEYADDLAVPQPWRAQATVVLTNTVQFHVDLSATNAPRRFYRVVEP